MGAAEPLKVLRELLATAKDPGDMWPEAELSVE
jgi:hypothetical protein